MPIIEGYQPCPEYSGLAVCVVCEQAPPSPLAPEKDRYKYVFEVDLLMDDGRRWVVKSKPFGASLHKRSNLTTIVEQWTGRVPPVPFDTDSMIGQTAKLVVVHDEREGKTYANIASYRPAKETLKPSGTYVRRKDRDNGQDNPY